MDFVIIRLLVSITTARAIDKTATAIPRPSHHHSYLRPFGRPENLRRPLPPPLQKLQPPAAVGLRGRVVGMFGSAKVSRLLGSWHIWL